MGKRSRSNLIADLKTAGQKGSLSKMNKTQLLALHSQITDGASHDIEAGQSLDMLQIRGGGDGSADDNLRPINERCIHKKQKLTETKCWIRQTAMLRWTRPRNSVRAK